MDVCFQISLLTNESILIHLIVHGDGQIKSSL